MDSIGAEVGQKMRSAIKAKLMELDCYVDDELPDYIMVMVANKRTKSQMNEDLQLFLNNKTSTFVDWLHIVLKKLKEVTVTNPDIYGKRTEKRKAPEIVYDMKVKKEKKEKKKKDDATTDTESQQKSLTDNLPITANRLAAQRKIVIMNENKTNHNSKVNDDGFDIPLLREVQGSSEQELEEIEKKIKNVKSRLGLLVESDDDQDCIKIKAENEDLLFAKEKEDAEKTQPRTVEIDDNSTELPKEDNPSSTTPEKQSEKRPEHRRITFTQTENAKKTSILDRLGKRPASESNSDEPSRRKTRISLSEFRKEEEKYFKSSRKADESSRSRKKEESRSEKRKEPRKESIMSRLGVMSKVSIPQKEPQEPEEEFKGREVASVIKIKPRVIPNDVPQPNKNLLLKAVAEAQRSVAQTPLVGSSLKPDALFTKKYKEKYPRKSKESPKENRTTSRKLSDVEKAKLKNLLVQNNKVDQDRDQDNSYEDEERDEYVPKPLTKQVHDESNYVPSLKDSENGDIRQQFIITLDGIEKTKFKDLEKSLEQEQAKSPIKSRLEGRRTPSPIIFDKATTASAVKAATLNIPDTLPVVHAPLAIKNKERCKYWPNCRQGDKCEFIHPSKNCEMFPHCKFGEKCLYIHPVCKFGTSCTKRDCPYSHSFTQKTAATRSLPLSVPAKISSIQQTCKFFPNCTNPNCTFFHPKPCKFGKYCKNQSDCIYLHTGSLTWRSKAN